MFLKGDYEMIKDIGEKFGKLTVIDRKREGNRTYYLCKCECKNEKWIRADQLKSGRIKSCGCSQYEKEDLVGKRFGRLIVIELCGERAKNGERKFKCKCDCGAELIVNAGSLLDKKRKSCGCLHAETSKVNAIKAFEGCKEKYFVDGTNIKLISKKDTIKSNKSGISGVYWDSNEEKWGVQLYFKGKCYRYGKYKNKEDAIRVRNKAKEELHENFLKELGE